SSVLFLSFPFLLTSINNSSAVCNILVHILSQPLSDRSMSVLSLLWSCHLSGSNGPDRFVGNNNFRPICFAKREKRAELSLDDRIGFSGFSVFKELATTKDNVKASFQSSFSLLTYKL